MYPTIVVVLVETRRSMADIYEIVPSNASKIAAEAASDDVRESGLEGVILEGKLKRSRVSSSGGLVPLLK